MTLFLAPQFTSLSDFKRFLLISGLLCPHLCSRGAAGEIPLPRLPLISYDLRRSRGKGKIFLVGDLTAVLQTKLLVCGSQRQTLKRVLCESQYRLRQVPIPSIMFSLPRRRSLSWEVVYHPASQSPACLPARLWWALNKPPPCEEKESSDSSSAVAVAFLRFCLFLVETSTSKLLCNSTSEFKVNLKLFASFLPLALICWSS